MEKYIIQDIANGLYLEYDRWDKSSFKWYASGSDISEFDSKEDAFNYYEKYLKGYFKVTFIKIYYSY